MISRLVTAGVVLVLVLMLALFWLLQPVDPIDPDDVRYTARDCRTVSLFDSETGREIVGIEDIIAERADVEETADTDGLPDRLILSAHDRSDETLPSGGLYVVSVWALDSPTAIEVENIVNLAAREEHFRPHGIALNEDGDRLALVNRPTTGEASVEIGDYDGVEWYITRRLSGARVCRANDLDFVDLGTEVEAVQMTLDRAECSASYRDLIPGARTGRVALWEGTNFQIMKDRLSFPNGIDGAYISETRKNRVLRPTGEPIRMPGAPDNISRADDRHIVAALHPSLRRLWLYMNDVAEAAPSRIVRANLLTAEVEVLFDDPQGALFSAATSAVLIGDTLIAGSAHDSGLLVCMGGTQ